MTADPAHVFVFVSTLGLVMTMAHVLITDRGRWREPFYSAAAALSVMGIGTLGRQAWILQHEDVVRIPGDLWGMYLFTAILGAGTAWAMGTFSSHRFGHYMWISVTSAAAAAALARYYFY